MMSVVYYRPAEVPAEACEFWKQKSRELDPVSCLVEGPEWFSMMAGDGAFVACLRDEDSVITGVLPFLPARWSPRLTGMQALAGKIQIRTLKTKGGPFIDERTDPAQLVTLLKRVLDDHADVQAVWFDHIAEKAFPGKLEHAAGGSGSFFCHDVYRDIPHYRLELPALIDELRKFRSRESLKKIEGRQRALARHAGAPCRIMEFRNMAGITPYAERIESMMGRTWQARLLGDRFSVSELEQVAGRGWLRSFLLLAGEKPAAFALCYQGMETLVYEEIGFSGELEKFSPGTILLYRLLESVYASDRPKYIDFGEGDAGYKKQLADNILKVSSLMLVRNGEVSRAKMNFLLYFQVILGVCRKMPFISNLMKRMKH